jgi:hypothetical protein
VRLIVCCLDWRHQVEPDPAETAGRYGAETTVPDWRERLVCSQCRIGGSPAPPASTIGGLRGIEVGEEMSDFGYSPHQIEFQMYYSV